MRSNNVRAVLLVAAVALMAAACGVTANSNPREIAADNVPEPILDPELTTTTTQAPSTASQPFPFYLATEGDEGPKLGVVEREVGLEATPVEIITTLLDLETTEDEADAGLTTNIPADTALLDAELDLESNVLTLDFNTNLEDSEGALQISAFAQIVYTATELEGVEQVRFLVEGEPIAVRVGDSSQTDEPGEPVDRADYPSYDPDSA